MFQFPASPVLNQIFTPVGGVSFRWNGKGWVPRTPAQLSEATADTIYVRLDQKGVALGVAELDVGGVVPIAQLPVNVANGIAPLGIDLKVPILNLPVDQAGGICGLDSSIKVPMVRLYAGVPSGLATLDGTGKVPISQLPSEGPGTGSVTSVSVVTANGVSGSVANPASTPAITLVLGAITPTSVNGVVILSGAGLAANTDGTLSANSDADVATQKAVKTYADATAAAAVVGKVTGAASATDNNLVIFDGASGKLVKDSGVLYTSLVIGPASVTDSHVALFDGTTGKLLKDGGALPAEGVVTLTDASTVSLDISLGATFDLLTTNAVGASRTINFTGGSSALDGKRILIRIKQDATGSRTVTWGTGARFGSDITSITLSTTANLTDYIGVIYHHAATKFDFVSYVRGF